MQHHSKQRYLFIDLLRFIAVVMMLQGHTFDALLSPSVKNSTLFFIHDFFHGFVAPMFLFASGVAFGISTFKKWEAYAVPGKPLLRRIAKFIGLLMIGYALHLPFFSARKIFYNSTPQDIASWLQVDALQCLALSLMVLQLLVLIARSEHRFRNLVGGAAVIVFFVSPVIWNLSFRHSLPLFIVSYLNAENNSWFPLFPWSGYVCSGVVFAHLFITAKEHRHAVVLMQKSVVVGIAMMIAALLLNFVPLKAYPPHDFWKVNPTVLVARTGFVLIAISSLFFAEHGLKIPARIPGILGRESLFIYVLHLLIIYGSVVNVGLQTYIGSTLGIGAAVFVFVVVLLAMSLFAYGWNRLKTNSKGTALFVRIAVVWLFIFYFLIRPY